MIYDVMELKIQRKTRPPVKFTEDPGTGKKKVEKLSPHDYVRQWIEDVGLSFAASELGFLQCVVGEKRLALHEATEICLFDLAEANARILVGKNKNLISETAISRVFSLLFAEAEARRNTDLLRSLAFRESERNPISEFVAAVCPSATKEQRNEYGAVIAHWIWQVKRKLAGGATDHEIMLIFFGPQATGKSSAIGRLLSPLTRFGKVKSTDFKSIDDPRTASERANYAVLLLDELAYLERAAAENLKRIVTDKTVTWRPMGTNDHIQKPALASLIGASNRDFSSLYRDDQQRRFYQIDVPVKADWAAINAIDYLAVWRSVDENAASPLLSDSEMFGNVRKTQQETLATPRVEDLFIEELRDQERGEKEVSIDELFISFNSFCENQKVKTSMSKIGFARLLKRAGFPSQRIRCDDGVRRAFYIVRWPEVGSYPHLIPIDGGKK
jgi:hypothetical protein